MGLLQCSLTTEEEEEEEETETQQIINYIIQILYHLHKKSCIYISNLSNIINILQHNHITNQQDSLTNSNSTTTTNFNRKIQQKKKDEQHKHNKMNNSIYSIQNEEELNIIMDDIILNLLDT